MSTRSRGQAVPILMYHSISAKASPRFKRFALSPAVFAEHMGYLRAEAYTTLTVSQLQAGLSAERPALPPRPVVITFDDGFADFYEHALPVLEHHRFCATVYVVSGHVGSTSGWLRAEGESERPLLNWTQLREISAMGIECGAHTHSHPTLDTISLAAARTEIALSKDVLEEHLSREVLSFAYPFGYYTSAVRAMVSAAGFTSACAVKYTMSSTVDDELARARLEVRSDTGVAGLAALLTEGTSRTVSTVLHARTKAWQVARQCRALLAAGEGVR